MTVIHTVKKKNTRVIKYLMIKNPYLMFYYIGQI